MSRRATCTGFGGLGLGDHVRLEHERRRLLGDAAGLDLGGGPNSTGLAREARRRAVVLHLRALLDGPRADAALAALGRWLDVDGGDAAALDRLIAALDEVDRKD